MPHQAQTVNPDCLHSTENTNTNDRLATTTEAQATEVTAWAKRANHRETEGGPVWETDSSVVWKVGSECCMSFWWAEAPTRAAVHIPALNSYVVQVRQTPQWTAGMHSPLQDLLRWVLARVLQAPNTLPHNLTALSVVKSVHCGASPPGLESQPHYYSLAL